MKKNTMIHRLLSFVMVLIMTLTTVFTGFVPVAANTTSVASEQEVTLTVIGDTGNHSSDTSAHTGYVYWMKDVPLNIDLDELSDAYIAKNCGAEIKAALAENKITAVFTDEDSLYAESLTKNNVQLVSDHTTRGYWSVIVAYADGSFSSDGWGEYHGAAQLKSGCRLIYYWSDDVTNDCRLSVDENYNTTLNYDTDAVTAVSLYTEEDADSAAKKVTCEAGQMLNLTAKLTVPANSKVSRTLTWKSSNTDVATVKATEKGAAVTAISAGTTMITASLINTLGDTIEAVCTVTVTADGTTITDMSFAEGEKMSLLPGDVTVLTPVFKPEPGSNEAVPSPTWTSSNETVASVDEKTGDIEALTPGTAVITALITNNKGRKVAASCVVTVETVEVTGITLNHKYLNLKQSETEELSIRFTPANATEIPDITWESTNEKAVTVTGCGTNVIVTAMSGGTATVIAKLGELTASCEVTVATGEEVIRLSELVFSKDKDGTIQYPVHSDLDPVTKECTVVIPENVNSFYLKPVLTDEETVTIQAQYQNYNFTKDLTKDLTANTFTPFSGTTRVLQSDQIARDMTIVLSAGTWVQTYTVHIVRESLVASLNVTDSEGTKLMYEPEFTNTTQLYEMTVADTIDWVNLAFTANHEGSTTLTVNGEPAQDGKYKLSLNGPETIAIIKAGNDTVIPAEYTLKVKRVTAGSYSFSVNPTDAVVAVYDSNNIRQWGENNTFSILPDEPYTYTISKTGYIAQTGTFTGSGTKQITLKKAPDTKYKQFEADWYGLRNDANNQGITDAPTPISPNRVGLKWENQYGQGYSNSAVSSQIIVDDKIYCYSASSLLVISKETGEILKSTMMAGSSSYAINPPSYANGMIFVGLSSGRIQAFNAETLESLWIYKDPLGGQPNCSIRYDDGYVYTGFWNSETREANWVCVSATDEDPAQQTEAKAATWSYTVQGGFYWAGAYTNENYLIVGSDDGTGGSDSASSYVYVFDKFTGKLMQQIGPCVGDIRSDISYYNGRIYFTTKAGYLYSYNLTKEGLIDEVNLIKPIKPGEMSTSTPVIYNNRAYIGVTHGSNFSGSYGIEVIDIHPETGELSLAYEVPTTGYPQTSGTLTTAYEKETGYVYVYFTVNSPNAELYVVKDKSGMTEADAETGVLYMPNHKQYCICSIVADKAGNLYFKNDSAYMMALAKNEVAVKDVKVSGGNAAFYGEETFNGSTLNHEIVVDPGTESVTISILTDEGIDVFMNEVSGAEQVITLKNGEAAVEVLLMSGDNSGSYSFKIRERSTDASLSDMMVSSSSAIGTAVTLVPAFEPDTKEYMANYYKTAASLYAWAMTTDRNAEVTAEIVSGASKIQTGASDGYVRARVYFEDTVDYETPAVVKFSVLAEDGITKEEYFVTMGVDTTAADITMEEPALQVRRADTAQIVYTVNQSGTLYYVVQEDGSEVPTAANVKKGTAVSAIKGKNVTVMEGLSESACDIHLVYTGYAGSTTDVVSIDVQEYDKSMDLYLAYELDEKIIEILGTVEITLDYKDDIEALREEYEALSDAQKAEMKNIQMLKAAEDRILELEHMIEEERVLAEAKAKAKNEISGYKNVMDYCEEQKAELLQIISDTKALIDTAKTVEAVNIAVESAKTAMDQIPTAEDMKPPYEDVSEADWFYDSVAYTYFNGLMTGMDATHFGPYGQLSRAQFALILYRMEEEPTIETEKTFGDIVGNEWYGPAVLWAAENGIVTGYQSGNFGPADLITREQMALMMYRYAKYLGKDTTKGDISVYQDAGSVSGFAADAMQWANGKGIITGKENGTRLDPQGNTARCEAAAIIQRFMNLYAQ